MIMPQLQDVLPIVRRAASLLVDYAGAEIFKTKGTSDFVTKVDFAVQETICSQLAANWPEIQFMGEEKDNTDIDFAKPYWVLDPVDGTTNLIHNFRASVISLALVADAAPLFGVIYNPYSDEMFTAVRGQGAFLNGNPIHVSDASGIQDALIFTGTAPYRRDEAKENFSRMMRVYLASHDIRRFGSTALELCYVACGRADGYFEFGVKPWDYAAGILILAEAGGEAVDVDGNLPSLEHECALVATNGNFTEELRALM